MAEYVGIKNILSQFWEREKANVAAQSKATIGNVETTIQGAINTLKSSVDALKSFEYAITETIPEATAENTGKIWLVAKENGTGYREYLVVKQSGDTYKTEEIGDTDIDLSGYQTKLTEQQLAAVNSGITAEKISSIDGSISALESAVADKITAADVNSALTVTDAEFDTIFTA